MVYFKEVLPNPVGKDVDGEWIKLINTGEENINLSGWAIKDAGGSAYSLSTSLPGGVEAIFEYSLTGITLNNNGDTLNLLNDAGEIVDTLVYSAASDDEIIIADRFIETIKEQRTDTPTLESLALVGKNKIVSGGELSAIAVAIIIALVMSIFVGLFLRGSEER